jgi:CheY-like chemotaxis protein
MVESSLEGVRVLLVDDNDDAREVMAMYLAAAGAIVVQCSSAARAMEELSGGEFDAVVADIQMPDEDGLSFIRRVRSLPAEGGGRIPALAITAGKVDTADREAAVAAGFQEAVVKPLDPGTLTPLVELLIAHRARR